MFFLEIPPRCVKDRLFQSVGDSFNKAEASMPIEQGKLMDSAISMASLFFASSEQQNEKKKRF